MVQIPVVVEFEQTSALLEIVEAGMIGVDVVVVELAEVREVVGRSTGNLDVSSTPDCTFENRGRSVD